MRHILFNLLAVPEPVRILTGQESPPPALSGQNYFAWASVLCIISAIALVTWRIRTLRKRPASVRAFDLLASRLSITESERALIQKMSVINGHISPLAMLVSPSAFARCRESLEAHAIGADRSAIAALTRKLKA